MANLKAMDSDWFGQTYMGRKSKVKTKKWCTLASFSRATFGLTGLWR